VRKPLAACALAPPLPRRVGAEIVELRDNDDLLEEARRDGKDRMMETARESGIIEQAQSNAKESISIFVSSLGYRGVVFT
jgi:hypothetical protein